METGQETSRSLVEKYLGAHRRDRPAAGPALRSVLEINPDALAIADRLDAERKSRAPRGPLHGIPILIKDNIATARSHDDDGRIAGARRRARRRRTRSSSTRLRDGGRRHPRQDEPERVGELPLDALVERLERARRADAESVRARSQPVRLELRLRRRGRGEPRARRPIGTETDGSIVSPSNNNSLVGIKPTLGLVSRTRHRPDRAQPGHGRARWRARSPTPRSLLGAMAGRRSRRRGDDGQRDAGADATTRRPSIRDGLKGARIGVVRNRLFGYSPAADRAGRGGDRRHEAAAAPSSSIRRTSRRSASSTTASSTCCSTSSRPTCNKYLAWLGPGVAGALAEGRDRVQRRAQGPGDAVLRPGDHGDGREEGAADRARSTSRRSRRIAGWRGRSASTR